MKKLCIAVALLMLCMAFVGCERAVDPPVATPTPSEVPTETPSITPTPTEEVNELDNMTLRERYADNFKVGVALSNYLINNPGALEFTASQFNSLTFENEMKPDHLLDAAGCRSGYPGTNTKPAVKFSSTTRGMEWAQKNGIGVRGHTLVWYSQTPSWFFTTDYKDGSPLASREVMLKRMESYIDQVMTYYQTTYPGVIYAWDVVNEALEPADGRPDGLRTGNNLWFETVGEDYVYWAFYYANKYNRNTTELYYNDYNCSSKRTAILKLVEPMLEKGLIDGIGMQCHLSTTNNIANDVYYTARTFAEAGLKVQITELDMKQASEGENADMAQAMKYKLIFEKMEKAQEEGVIDFSSLTVWGLYDQVSWIQGNPLLFTVKGNGIEKKLAWYGAMQDPDIMAIEW